MKAVSTTLVAMVMVCACAGCASYAAPGRGADLTAVGAPSAEQFGSGTDSTIRQSFDKRPMARFPAAIAVARIQASGYKSRTSEGYGSGRYSLVTERDIEKPEQFERLAKLPQVHGIAPVGRLLMDSRFDSELPLRQAAARLQADMILIYTLDTTFKTDNKAVPLSMISLGLSPSEKIEVSTTASAILMDTRNGFLYGLAEATVRKDRMVSSWGTGDAVDESRKQTEADAFEKLVGELETTWKNVVATHAKSAEVAQQAR